MNTKNATTLVSLKMSKEFHKRLKTAAALTGFSMTDIILLALDAWHECFESKHLPNKSTLKSLKNIEEGKNIFEALSVEDLFKKALR